ncbi:MAG: squalene/phytoene synthase family protein [Planctomycetota bacterium]|nr:squalene/phytoene synthase family protein [Planctomycetota bacterium]
MSPPPPLDVASLEQFAARAQENFSVLSPLTPQRLRPDFSSVYAFCRLADDLGDDYGLPPGVAPTPEHREAATHRLGELRARLRQVIAEGGPSGGPSGRPVAGPRGESPYPFDPMLLALRDTIERHRVPVGLFEDLLSAFEQDQRVLRYETWAQLLDYCTRSANPVGRIVLHLLGVISDEDRGESALLRCSDAICTGLQLINFWQDVRRDLFDLGRIYLPRELTGWDEGLLREWANRGGDAAARVPFILGLRPLVDRTEELFEQGRPLAAMVRERLRSRGGTRSDAYKGAAMIELFRSGGVAILGRVRATGCATLWHRPRLSRRMKAGLVFKAFMKAWVSPASPANAMARSAS